MSYTNFSTPNHKSFTDKKIQSYSSYVPPVYSSNGHIGSISKNQSQLSNKQKGILHVYDYSSEKLKRSRSTAQEVIFEPGPTRGKVFEVHRCCLVTDGNSFGPPLVAKRYISKFGFRDDLIKQQMACKFAENFNQILQKDETNKIQITSNNKILELNNDFYILEPRLTGSYTHFSTLDSTSTDATSDSNTDTIRAFAHYAYVSSGHKYLITSLHGVGSSFTQVEATNSTNLFQKFCETHECNTLCRKVGLTRLPSMAPSVSAEPQNANELPSERWEWCDNHRSHPYDIQTQSVLKDMESQGSTVLKITVGDITHSFIDLRTQQQMSLRDGESFYVHRRTLPKSNLEGAETYQLQLELDDGGWHSYDPSIQKLVVQAIVQGLGEIEVSMNGTAYDLNFHALTQTNRVTGKQRRIRLVQFVYETAASAEVQSPSRPSKSS